MGRKKDPIWDHVEKLDGKKFKCKNCGEEFAGGASRIKAHLSGIERKGIRKCTGVPKDVQIEASSTFGDSNKTPCRGVNPCNPQQDFVNSSKGKDVLVQSDIPEECILFPELLQMATGPTIIDSNQRIMNNVDSDSIEGNCLNSNQSDMGNVNSGDPKENHIISNQSITRNIHSADLSKGKSINMGGKNDGFSHNVEPGLNGGVKNRMYDHVDISQTETMGVDTEKLDVDICSEDPEDVQEAAYDASNKRLKKNIDASHHEDNFVNLNSQSSTLKGNTQLYRMPTTTDFVGTGVHIHADVPEHVQRRTYSTINDSNQTIAMNVNSSFLEENSSEMNYLNFGAPKENHHISNRSITRNIHSSDCSKGKSITGRKKDQFWQYVETYPDGKVKCKFCEHEFVALASRIKWHLSKTKNMGIKICSDVPEDVQKAAYDAAPRPVKTISDSSHLEQNLVNSNSQISSSKGNIDSSHTEDNIVNMNSLSTSPKGNVELNPMPTSMDFIGEQFQSYIDKIWDWIMNEKESFIGVCGMGGVGKSTLLRHVYNKLLDASRHVIWVDVPQDLSVLWLQKAIADPRELHQLDSDDSMKIAAMLFHAFKRLKKSVIILDNMWNNIDLERVGIPLANSEVQVIMASRLLDVCQKMSCKEHIVNVEPLSDDKDRSGMFSKILGKDKFLSSYEEKIKRSMIRKSDGLPLMIAAMARSMRTKEYRRDKNVSEMVEDEMKRSVFPVLKLSYDHLNDKIIQECFLLFALRDLCLESDRLSLIEEFVDEGLINRKNSLEEQLYEGHNILNRLINNNLLYEEGMEYVRFHIWIRDMAVGIAKSKGYLVKYREDLREVQAQLERKEDLQKLCLFGMEEIPSAMSLKCPRLSTLNLRWNCSLKLIPDCFFINMPSLKVLNLSFCRGIEHLPESVSNLESLTALLLGGCISLKYVPSLAKLQKLEKLDLSCTAITELPLGLGKLISLIWLNLERTEQLRMSPASVIPKLTNLQVLLLDTFYNSMNVKAVDLEALKVLESIKVSFSGGNEFNAYVRGMVSIRNCGLRNYYLQLVGKQVNYLGEKDGVYGTHKSITFEGIRNAASLLLPVDMKNLSITGCNKWRSLCAVLSFESKNRDESCKISSCTITKCAKLENVFCLSCSFCRSFQSLETLSLYYLESLKMLCKETNVATTTHWARFSSLRNLHISKCHSMKTLLTPGITGHLRNLETLEVSDCNAVEEIFSSEKNNERTHVDIDDYSGTERYYQGEQVANAGHIDHTHATRIQLPKLKSLKLQRLPHLNSVCEGILVCDSLESFEIYYCSMLELVPQIQPPIQITRK